MGVPCGGIRLRHRGGRRGGMRAGQPAHRGSGDAGAAAGGGRLGPQPVRADTQGVLPADGRRAHRLALPGHHRAGPPGDLAARTDDRRLDVGERHDLEPRRGPGLGRPRTAGLGLVGHGPRVPATGGSPARARAAPGHRRPGAAVHRHRHRPARRGDGGDRRRAGLAPRRRPGRPRRRADRLPDRHHPRRTPGQRRRRVPAPGAAPAQPDRRGRRRRPAGARRGRPRHRCTGRARRRGDHVPGGR